MLSQTDRHKATLRQFMAEVWNDGNVDACDRFLAPAYTIRHDPGDPWHQQTLDLAGFKERVSLSRMPFPDQRFEIQELVGDGDTLACTWLWTGTHLGPLAQFPPSGRRLTMSGMTIYYFEQGLICGHWQVVDRLSLFQQLASSAPPPGGGAAGA